MATVATGMPDGICTVDSSASSPPRSDDFIGMPMTGSVVPRGQRARKVRGLACGGQNHAEAVFPRLRGEARRFGGRAVRAHNMHFRGYAVARQRIQRLPHDRQVAVAPHYNGNFSH